MKFDREQLKKFYDEAQKTVAESETNEGATFSGSRYQEVEEYAHGGLKSIIRTKDSLTKRQVAKAVMGKTPSQEGKERFLREAVINSLLEHPNIMPVYDIGFEKDASPFFIMKFVEGYDLAEIIKELAKRNPYFQQKYPLNNLLAIFIKICDAIGYAHSKGVIHRDLKPANVKVGEFGEVLVCDWGLGKFVSDEVFDETVEFDGFDMDLLGNGITIDTMLKGTPGFMSPEQIAGGGKSVNMASDIYALGAILYTILTYKRPFSGRTLGNTLKLAEQGKLPLPSDVTINQVPSGLEAVVLKAMHADPAQRYQTVEELREEIDNYLNGFATAAEDAGFITSLKLFYQRNRKVSALFLVSATLIIFGSVYSMMKIRNNEQQALKALSLYQQERKEKMLTEKKYSQERAKNQQDQEKYSKIQQAGKALAQKLMQQARTQYIYRQLELALSTTRKALAADPANSEIILFKAKLHITMLDFNSVLKMAEQQEFPKDHSLTKIALKYILVPRDAYGRIKSTSDFFDLLDELKTLKFNEMVICLLVKEKFEHRDKAQSMKIVEYWLRMDNPKLQALNFKVVKGPHGFNVDLSGNEKLKNIRAVQTITIGHLDISNSGVNSLHHIKNKPVFHSLNASNTALVDLKEIKKIPNLKRLVLSEKQFPRDWVATLPERIKVEYVPAKNKGL